MGRERGEMQNILISPSMILTESPPWGFKIQAFKFLNTDAVLIKTVPICFMFLNGLNYQSYLLQNIFARELFAILIDVSCLIEKSAFHHKSDDELVIALFRTKVYQLIINIINISVKKSSIYYLFSTCIDELKRWSSEFRPVHPKMTQVSSTQTPLKI